MISMTVMPLNDLYLNKSQILKLTFSFLFYLMEQSYLIPQIIPLLISNYDSSIPFIRAMKVMSDTALSADSRIIKHIGVSLTKKTTAASTRAEGAT